MRPLRLGGEVADGGDHLAGLGGGEIGLAREPHQIGVAFGVLGEQRDAAIGVQGRRDARRWRGARSRPRWRSSTIACSRRSAGCGLARGSRRIRARRTDCWSRSARAPASGRAAASADEPRNGERPFEQRIGGVHAKMHEGVGWLCHASSLRCRVALVGVRHYGVGFAAACNRSVQPSLTRYPSFPRRLDDCSLFCSNVKLGQN